MIKDIQELSEPLHKPHIQANISSFPNLSLEQTIEQVISLAEEVHQELGPGLLDSAYRSALLFELQRQNVHTETQVELPVLYKGHMLGMGCKLDILVNKELVVEVKAVDELTELHKAKLVNGLKIMHGGQGLLINFNVSFLEQGIEKISL